MSYGEVADLSSSQHRCQDWGRTLVRGPRMDYLELMQGEEADPTGDFFAGINTSWSRVEGGENSRRFAFPGSKSF